MSNRPYVLTIDCGTQSLRAMVFDATGDLIALERCPYTPYVETNPGWAEQDPQVYWEALLTTLAQLKSRRGELLQAVEGIGVTTQRDTMVSVDREGKTLRNAITWLDQRKAATVYKPRFPIKLAYKAVGMLETIRKIQREGKSNWIKQNQPALWEQTYKYVSVAGLFHFRMTGSWKDSTANQIGHIPFDYRRQQWATPSKLTAKIYPIEREKLADLVSPGERVGKITAEFSRQSGIAIGTPVIACGSDKGCETLGMGVTAPDTASLSFGTTATIQTTTRKYVEPLKFLPAYPAPIPGHFNPEVEIFRGFWMITWFKEQFGFKEVAEAEAAGISPEQLLDRTLETVPPGSMGLLIQPYWSPGIKEPMAKGAMVGFGSVHTREYMYRAMIEGLCYALLEGAHRIEKATGSSIKHITVSGGASLSDGICRIASDVFGLPLLRGKTAETSGLGAAMVTQYGIGTYPSAAEASQQMVSFQREFTPNTQNHRLYRKLFAAYEKLYPALKHLYRHIGKVTGYPEM